MSRRFIGIDINSRFIEIAQARVNETKVTDLVGWVDNVKVGDPIELRVGRPAWLNAAEIAALPTTIERPLNKTAAKKKYQRKTYGRVLPGQLDLPPNNK
jgi:hypothetical protein